MRGRRLDAILAEVRDLLFRLCVAAGLVLGVFAGLERPTPKAVKCEASDPCVAEQLTSGMERVLIPAGVGMLCGAAVGLGLALLLRRRALS